MRSCRQALRGDQSEAPRLQLSRTNTWQASASRSSWFRRCAGMRGPRDAGCRGSSRSRRIGTLADVVAAGWREPRDRRSWGSICSRKGPHKVGLRALLDVSGLSGKTVDSYHIGFMVAPRVNAAGRMSTPDIATRLLLAADETMAEEARQLALQLGRRERATAGRRSGDPGRREEDRPDRSGRRRPIRPGRRRRRLAPRRDRHRGVEARRRVSPAGDRAVGGRRRGARLVPQHSAVRHAGRARALRPSVSPLRRTQAGGGPRDGGGAHQGASAWRSTRSRTRRSGPTT